MSPAPGRYIRSRVSSRQIPDLLQSLFAAEFLAPSASLWLVSPWISDIPILDNRANGFSCFQPSWPRGQVRLTQILAELADLGTAVHLALRPDPHNEGFLGRLEAHPAASRIAVSKVKDLHEKCILGDSFYLSGSMNFTYNGITLNEEGVTYDTTPEVIVERRLIFEQRWGSEVRP